MFVQPITGGGWDRKVQLGNLFGKKINFCSLFVVATGTEIIHLIIKTKQKTPYAILRDVTHRYHK